MKKTSLVSILCFLMLSLSMGAWGAQESSSKAKSGLRVKIDLKSLKAKAAQTKSEWQNRRSLFLSQATLKRQLRAQQNLAAKKPKRALSILDKVLKRSSSTEYEKAKTLVLKAQALMQIQKYKEAQEALNQALAKEILSYRESCEALLLLSQSQLVTEDFLKSKENILNFIEISNSNLGVAHVILASVEFQLKDYKKAQDSIDKALGYKKNPQDTWLFLAANIHYKNKSFAPAEKYLKTLLRRRQNNKSYWMALIPVLMEQDKQSEALKYYEMAEKMGHVKNDTELLNRASLMGAEAIPYKAAQISSEVLTKKGKKEIKASDYENVGNYWLVAKEFNLSIDSFKKASGLSKNPRIDLMLAQVYLEKEDFAQARGSFKRAFDKSKKENYKAQALVGMGVSSFFMQEKEEALKYFKQAKEFKSQKATAEKWMGMLQ